MAKALTAAAVNNLRPGKRRREIPDPGCRGLYLIVQPTGAKVWAMRINRPNGKRSKLTLGPYIATELAGVPVIGQPLSPSAARALGSEVKRQSAQALDVVAQHQTEKRRRRTAAQERGANTFAQAARDFIDHHKVGKTGQKPRRWRENARMLGLSFPIAGGEPTVIRRGLCERWEEKSIADIDGDSIYGVVDEVRRHGVPGLEWRTGSVSDSRARKMVDVLGTMFGWLHAHRRIVVNPCIGAYRPPPPAARERVLNTKADVRAADELRWLWQACNAVGDPFGALVKVLLLTGCRLNEIARMQRTELSDDLATLRLPGARTKNGRGIDIPLPPLVREILESLPEDGPFVFSTNGKTAVSGFSKYKARLDALMLDEAAKDNVATIAPWRLHDLRRTCATGMANIGVMPHIIEACLNHVSGAKSGIAGVYNVASYEAERLAALQRWADHVASVVLVRKRKIVALRGRT
jgi:integrase